jgi:catechol 2,3-dioxygenase-like lactoylglutathione lyase family enzyme
MADGIGRFHWVVIDSVEPARIAPFWCELLGVRERGWFGEDYLMLERGRPHARHRLPAGPRGQGGQEPAPRGRGRGRRGRVARILEIGGSIASEPRELDGYRWRVMADPEGNEFCVVPREED